MRKSKPAYMQLELVCVFWSCYKQLVSKMASLRALISVGHCDPWSYMYEMTCLAVNDKTANPVKYAAAHDIFFLTQSESLFFYFWIQWQNISSVITY